MTPSIDLCDVGPDLDWDVEDLTGDIPTQVVSYQGNYYTGVIDDGFCAYLCELGPAVFYRPCRPY